MDLKKTFGNLKRIPSWAWMLFLYLALFLRDLAANMTVNHNAYLEFIDMIAADLPNLAPVTEALRSADWVQWIVQPAIYVLLFELVSSLVISLAMGRRALTVQKSFIMYDFRIFYVGATLVSALLSLFLLALPFDYGYYYMELIKIPVYAVCYMLYYYFDGKNSIVWGQKAAIWQLIATLVGIWFVVNGFFLFVGALTAEVRVTGSVVMCSITFAFSILTTAALFVFGNYLKKEERKNPPPPPAAEEEEEPPEIFKGFGF